MSYSFRSPVNNIAHCLDYHSELHDARLDFFDKEITSLCEPGREIKIDREKSHSEKIVFVMNISRSDKVWQYKAVLEPSFRCTYRSKYSAVDESSEHYRDDIKYFCDMMFNHIYLEMSEDMWSRFQVVGLPDREDADKWY